MCSALLTEEFMSIFSKEYWACAVGELKKPRMLVFAAVLVAMRVVLKAFSIPIIPGQLYITFGFLVNALGSMVYGPFIAVFSGAVSDTVGTILFPKGPYFFPYIFQEIAGSLIFALFLYKKRINVPRIIAARFSVSLWCNIIIQPLIVLMWNAFYPDSAYSALSELKIIKNICMFPFQTLLLTAFLGAMMPAMRSLKFVSPGDTSLKVKVRHGILLGIFSLIMLVLFCVYRELKKPGSIPWFSFIHNLI